jgi:hypothetical protein
MQLRTFAARAALLARSAHPEGLQKFTARLLLAVSLAAMSPVLAADMPSGESLLERFIAATGGAEAYAKVKSSIMDGSVEMVGRNIAGTVTIIEVGEKSWTAMDFPAIGRVEEGFDGQTAWENSALQGPRILEGDEKAAVKRASSLSIVTNWRTVYKSAQTLGSEAIDGKPAWQVEMSPNEGKPETFFFDKDSGLLIKVSTVLSTPLGEIPASVIMSDYRVIDGIRTPFTMTQQAINQTIVMRFNKIVYNAAVPRDRFDLPAPVKTLIERKKQQVK